MFWDSCSCCFDSVRENRCEDGTSPCGNRYLARLHHRYHSRSVPLLARLEFFFAIVLALAGAHARSSDARGRKSRYALLHNPYRTSSFVRTSVRQPPYEAGRSHRPAGTRFRRLRHLRRDPINCVHFSYAERKKRAAVAVLLRRRKIRLNCCHYSIPTLVVVVVVVVMAVLVSQMGLKTLVGNSSSLLVLKQGSLVRHATSNSNL
mmetsp:Transcript_17968/g.33980  ORF Transcript_17968/g.33980 Transcript_17968/m.33980 type:complete len:205 (-) Transcript_17968:90-704(-)